MAQSATPIPVWILLLGPELLALCAWAWVGRGPGARFWADPLLARTVPMP